MKGNHPIIPMNAASIRHKKIKHEQLNLLVEASYSLACVSVLKIGYTKPKQIDLIKQHIRTYLLQSSKPKKRFKKFCSQLLTENWHINKGKHPVVKNLEQWLNLNNPLGFNITAKLLKQFERTNKKNNTPCNALKIWSKGYLKFTLKPSAKHYHQTRLNLLQNNEKTLQQLFSIATYHYTNNPMKFKSQLIDKNGILERRPAKLNELAQLYQMHRDTFRKIIKRHESEIGKKEGHFFTCEQVKIITNILGLPDFIHIEHGE